ncbi:MAG: hypothetical protein IRZ33_05610 [Alicyclobacillaceae bacterium]|nr:hypothetical protein [Alicyclobacillaceae bacterium]
MGRRLEWGADALTVHLAGLTAVAAFKRKLVIPYRCIVRVDTKAPPQESLMRLGGTAIGNIRGGHFWHGEDWYFLSYEDPEKVVAITLADFHLGHRRYSTVVIGVEDPQAVKEMLERRMPARASNDGG